MKKVISILIAILTLVVLALPAAAGELVADGTQPYYINQVYDNIPGLYSIKDSDDTVIEYFITFEFDNYLTNEYDTYKYSVATDMYFIDYLDSLLPEDEDEDLYVIEIAYSYIQSFLARKFQHDIYNTFCDYKNDAEYIGEQITKEGFEKYLESNLSMQEFYNSGIDSLYNELNELSSSSSSGSSGGSTPGENQGEHYGASHNNSNHIITDTDCCYNPGYNDGLLDGADEYKESNEYQETINNSKTEAVEEYFESEEYKSAMESLKTEIENTAVQQYKEGDEYKASIDSAYIVGSENGVASAYDKAAEEMYNLGKAEGFNEFRNSQECVDVMDSCYGQGWKDGENHANENAINPGGVIVTVILILAGSALLLVLSRIKHKKKK